MTEPGIIRKEMRSDEELPKATESLFQYLNWELVERKVAGMMSLVRSEKFDAISVDSVAPN